MGENSKIEWTKHTANLWQGCTKVHAGCDHCYAETLSKRWGNDVWGPDKPRMAGKGVWDNLRRFQKEAAAAGEIHRVFVGSMMDIFEKPMPIIDHLGNPGIYANDGAPFCTDVLRDRFFDEVVPASPNLMFLLLTKRPSNINKMIPKAWKDNPPQNVMFGCSPVDQKTADKLIPQLLKVNGFKFLSIEPQLGPISLTNIDAEKGGDKDWIFINCLTGAQDDMGRPCPPIGRTIDWVIQGGESGHHRRPFDLQWARDIREQCKKTNTAYFFKQIDKVLPIPEDLMIREFPELFKCPICNDYDEFPTRCTAAANCLNTTVAEEKMMKDNDTQRRHCPNCKDNTTQTIALYDPDDHNSGQVWKCGRCQEHTDWVSN